MLYVSKYDKRNQLYGVTDTDDGQVTMLTKGEVLEAAKQLAGTGLKINGVAGSTISVVSLTGQVMGVGFAKIEKQVDALIAGWSVDACMEVGRSGHFVSKLKGKSEDEVRRITKTYVYPASIRDAVSNAEQYTNQLREVNVADRNAVIQALSSNVCLVLQQKSTGVLTSFVCSGSLGVLDKVYETLFFDAVYLTKQLYGYTYDAAKLRPRTQRQSAKKPDLLNVFSCSLRFRNDGKNHDKGNKVLSSPFYSVNLGKLFCMYILDNPGKLGDTILPEFSRGQHTGVYDFDFDLFREVVHDIQSGNNSFSTAEAFASYVDVANLQKGVTLEDIADRYCRDFNYMRKLRQVGVSFVDERP